MCAGHLVIDLWFVVGLDLECGFLGLYIFGYDCEFLLPSLHTSADNKYNRAQTDTQTSLEELEGEGGQVARLLPTLPHPKATPAES